MNRATTRWMGGAARLWARRLHGCALLLGVAMGLAAAPARADLQVLITKGVTDPIPIAIVPFARAVPADGAFDVAAVVQHDLESSGRFRAMQRRDMLSTPSSANDVQAADWKAAGNDYVAVGRVTAGSGSELDVECDLINIQTGSRVASQKFIANSASLRNAAHLVSDFIYGKILGVRGAFATRIAYVAVRGQPPSQHFQLIVADADGENPKVILESSQPIMSPSWSPDEQWLAYVSFENRLSGVYVQKVHTGERQLVSARVGVNGAPAYSPDGTHLALTLSGAGGHLAARSEHPGADATDGRSGGRYRGGVERGWQEPVFHFRSRRRAADLQARYRAAQARGTHHLWFGLQRPAARVAGRQENRLRDARWRQLSNRGAGSGFRHRECALARQSG